MAPSGNDNDPFPSNIILSSLPEEDIDNDDKAKIETSTWEEKNSKMHWILHFDINETILVGDEEGGDTIDDCYNKIIAKSAFCQMPNDNMKYDYDNTSILKPTHWWDGTPLISREDDNNSQEQNHEQHIPPLYTGWNWPKGCCPYYRTSYKKISKTFVQHHGSIYKPLQDEMIRRLTAATERPEVFHNILPALFQTIYTLVHHQQHQQSQKLTIVFRTFGTDLPNIAAAVTAFAQGKHPDYPDFIHPEYELEESRLYDAKWVAVEEEQQEQQEETTNDNNDNNNNSNSNKQYFQYQLYRYPDNTLAAAGDEQVLEILHGDTSHHNNNNKHCVYGIRDDYPMWNRHNCEPWAGKPVWITTEPQQQEATSSSGQHHHHHVLFDDNIHNLPHDGIASVRRRRRQVLPSSNHFDQHVFESLSGTEIQSMQGLHLVRVPTIEPILNEHWFVEQFQKVQGKAMETYKI